MTVIIMMTAGDWESLFGFFQLALLTYDGNTQCSLTELLEKAAPAKAFYVRLLKNVNKINLHQG